MSKADGRRARRRARGVVWALAAMAGACAASSSPSIGERQFDAADLDPALASLPAGEGRAILQAACTTCHDLGGLQAYKGYYDADHWRGMVAIMIDHGAEVETGQVPVLVEYLTTHFGPGSPS